MTSAPSPTGPLEGITVLDLSTVGPAARCTRLLADYGARVVKVGPVPSADAVAAFSRRTSPTAVTAACGGSSSTSRTARGGRPSSPWPDAADVVVESFRPGVVDRLGIGYEAVSARNPGIVYCSTTGYGQDGPQAQWAGHDIDYLAVGGYLAMSTPGPDGAPPLPGATVADAAAGGMQAALAITAALARRGASGRGAYLDVSVAEGVLWLMSLLVDEQLARGGDIHPGHDILTGRYACYGTYRAGDGKWLAVGAIESKFFANLCAALGCPELAGSQLDDDAQPAHPCRPRCGLRHPQPRRVGRRARRGRHLRGPGPRDRRGGRPRAGRRPPGCHHGDPPDRRRAAAAGAPPGRYGARTVLRSRCPI